MAIYNKTHSEFGCTLDIKHAPPVGASELLLRAVGMACPTDVHTTNMRQSNDGTISVEGARVMVEDFLYEHYGAAQKAKRDGSLELSPPVGLLTTDAVKRIAPDLGGITMESAMQAVIDRRIFDEAAEEAAVRKGDAEAYGAAEREYMANTMGGASPLPFDALPTQIIAGHQE